MGMNIRVELCHVDTLRCVVRVEAWNDSQLIGSSLGEAATAEEAEDRAWQRLSRRLESKKHESQEHEPSAKASAATSRSSTPELIRKESQNPQQSSPVPLPEQPTKPLTSPSGAGSVDQQVEGDVRTVIETPSESPTDPDDWSEELTAIDFELKRIGWTREQERQYLERAFGHGSRHRLTRYADLVDQMLSNLGWTGEQARSFLQQHLNSTSRQQLSDEQLLQFNMLLEEQTLKK
jgi:DNA-nicking Smr family endonuclease